MTLKTDSDAESASGIDYVNAARNAPNKVILKVIESDVGHAAGWASRMLQALESLKRSRTLCNVVTSGFTYTSMLLTDLSVTEDEKSQSGWQGSLTFTQFAASAAAVASPYATTQLKTNDQSSTPTHIGYSGPTAYATVTQDYIFVPGRL